MADIPVKQALLAGFARAYIYRKSTAGYAMGITGSLANGEDAGPYEIIEVQTADMEVPEPEKTQIQGNNRFSGAFTWPLGESPSGAVQAAAYDMDLAVAFDSNQQVFYRAAAAHHLLGPSEVKQTNLGMILISDAQSKTEGYKGQMLRFGYLAPAVQGVYRGMGSFTQRDHLPVNMSLTVNPADVFPWGEQFALATHGGDDAILVPWFAWNDMVVHTFIGDGATDSFDLAFTPKGDHTGDQIVIYQDGVALTPTTDWQNVGKTVTFQAGSIPAAGTVNVVYYCKDY